MTNFNVLDALILERLTAEVVMAGALHVGDVVGSGGSGARDGFGAYGIKEGNVAFVVTPCSIVRIHFHAVPVHASVRITPEPVCERAAAIVHK